MDVIREPAKTWSIISALSTKGMSSGSCFKRVSAGVDWIYMRVCMYAWVGGPPAAVDSRAYMPEAKIGLPQECVHANINTCRVHTCTVQYVISRPGLIPYASPHSLTVV